MKVRHVGIFKIKKIKNKKKIILKSVKTMLVLLIVQYYGQELPTDYYLD